MNKKRVFCCNHHEVQNGTVIYWMSRDQRMRDNWALIYAQDMAVERKQPLRVVFCLAPYFLGATRRQYGFMLRGLFQLQQDLKQKQIAFDLIVGSPESMIPTYAKRHQAGLIVTDFDPLRIKMSWRQGVAKALKIALHEVDTHNIVPCREVSQKSEYGAYTLRPKIQKVLDQYLVAFPTIKTHPFFVKDESDVIDVEKILKGLKIDHRISEVDWIEPGETAAHRMLRSFMRKKFSHYDAKRNDPNKDAQSNLSPYLHFGQVAAQRVALEVMKADDSPDDQKAFLDELITWKELADNFCLYNPRYDQLSGMRQWAIDSLSQHRSDKREHVYTLKQFEAAETHDELWNAAQRQMMRDGKMHGYLRMYWGKKILEWSKSPEEAFSTAIDLNDKYELDGRDPNGYAGVAWAIGGMHDRAWFERSIFGKIRYMSYNGCRSKFDVAAYVKKYSAIKALTKKF